MTVCMMCLVVVMDVHMKRMPQSSARKQRYTVCNKNNYYKVGHAQKVLSDESKPDEGREDPN